MPGPAFSALLVVDAMRLAHWRASSNPAPNCYAATMPAACNGADWRPRATLRPGLGRGAMRARFFQNYFDRGQSATGAPSPPAISNREIAGSRTRRPGFEVPVYAMPTDLVRAWPDDVPEAERTGRPPLGRYDARAISCSITTARRSRTARSKARRR